MYIPNTYGSSAYKETPAWQAEERQAQEISSRRAKKQAIRATKAKRMKKAAAVIVAWAMVLTVLFRYAMIAEQCKRVETMNTELAELQNQVVKKQLELDKQVDLNKVEEYAVQELGMVRPEKTQEVYVSLRQDDSCEVVATEDKQGFFGVAFNRIIDALEYLY